MDKWASLQGRKTEGWSLRAGRRICLLIGCPSRQAGRQAQNPSGFLRFLVVVRKRDNLLEMVIEVSAILLPSLTPHDLSPQLTEESPIMPFLCHCLSVIKVRSLLIFNILSKSVDERS